MGNYWEYWEYDVEPRLERGYTSMLIEVYSLDRIRRRPIGFVHFGEPVEEDEPDEVTAFRWRQAMRNEDVI